MQVSMSDNALLRSKSKSLVSGRLGWLLSVARWAQPTISSRWAQPTDECCGCCCALSVVVARWTEPTAVELPAVTADNLSKVGTWWFRMVLVSSPVPTSNDVFVNGISSGGADWQVSTGSVIGGLGLVSMYGKPVTIQSGLL